MLLEFTRELTLALQSKIVKRIIPTPNGSVVVTNAEAWVETRKTFPHRHTLCWTVPKPWELSINNKHWQVMTLPRKKSDGVQLSDGKEKRERAADEATEPGQTIYLYSAHYDDRLRGEKEDAARVRLLVISEKYVLYYLIGHVVLALVQLKPSIPPQRPSSRQ